MSVRALGRHDPKLVAGSDPARSFKGERQRESIRGEGQVLYVFRRGSAKKLYFLSRRQVALQNAGRFIGEGEAGAGQDERFSVPRESAVQHIRLGIAR
jgi:hypothetical protein